MLSEKLEIKYNEDVDNSEEFLEDLDHVVLKERQRMLLSRSSSIFMVSFLFICDFIPVT